MEFMIRRAVMEDYSRLLPIQQQVAQIHHDGRPDVFRNVVRFTKNEFAANLLDPGRLMLVAQLADGTIAGFSVAWVNFCRNHPVNWDSDSFYIDDICVLEQFRRMGIGKALMEACVQAAKERHCKDIQLGVWSFNKEAIAFYTNCGMTVRTLRMEMRLEE